MADNELLNILNPQAAPYLSVPPIERGPFDMANVPRFQSEPKPYSINTNAIGLLGQVLQEIVLEGTVPNLIENFSGVAQFPGPGDSTMHLGYNTPTDLGFNNDWEIGMQVPFDF